MNDNLLEEFFEQNYNMFVKRIHMRVRDPFDAEDIVMDAFRRAIEYYSSYDPTRKVFGAWFNTILNNSLRTYQKEKFMKHIEVEEEAEIAVEDSLEDLQLYEKIIAFIDTEENDEVRDVLYLFFILGYKYRDIEMITECPVRNARFFVDRFKQKMREEFEDEGMCR